MMIAFLIASGFVFLVFLGTAVIALVNGQRVNRSYLRKANQSLDRLDNSDQEQ